MNSYRRGLRNGVLVNPKLFILEKVNFGPHAKCWSNLVKYGQTQSNLVKRVTNLYYLVRVITDGGVIDVRVRAWVFRICCCLLLDKGGKPKTKTSLSF